MSIRRALVVITSAITIQLTVVSISNGHGDVQPQAVDIEGLEPLGDEFELENPYRLAGGEQYDLAKEIGASGYNQNCARCHGLEAISGGIAPDLRMLEKRFSG